MRLYLRELKQSASRLAKKLTVSTLQYEGNDSLAYLTCIPVEDEDIPRNKMKAEAEAEAEGEGETDGDDMQEEAA